MTIAKINESRDAQALSEVSAGQIWLQMAHRFMAAIIGLTIAAFWFLVRRENYDTPFLGNLRTFGSAWLSCKSRLVPGLSGVIKRPISRPHMSPWVLDFCHRDCHFATVLVCGVRLSQIRRSSSKGDLVETGTR